MSDDDKAIGRSLSDEIGYWLESASRTLEKRYGNGVPQAKQDVLLAHYLYGLTAVVHAGDAPAAHLAAVRSYLERLIPKERVAAALRAVPEEDDVWLENRLDRVEAIGENRAMRCWRAAPTSSFHFRAETLRRQGRRNLSPSSATHQRRHSRNELQASRNHQARIGPLRWKLGLRRCRDPLVPSPPHGGVAQRASRDRHAPQRSGAWDAWRRRGGRHDACSYRE